MGANERSRAHHARQAAEVIHPYQAVAEASLPAPAVWGLAGGVAASSPSPASRRAAARRPAWAAAGNPLPSARAAGCPSEVAVHHPWRSGPPVMSWTSFVA